MLEFKTFSSIDLSDPFFDSLKEDYSEFKKWFNKKASQQEKAFVMYDDTKQIQAFLYLKEEEGPIKDVTPEIPNERVLKVGTLKINAHGTKLGERFIKKIFDYALEKDISTIYVTVFSKHKLLIGLISKYGFTKSGKKTGGNGEEDVYIKSIEDLTNNDLLNYPKICKSTNKRACYILGIKPEYHTKLFPDSILQNEIIDSESIIKDVSETNSIHKIYICRMTEAANLKRGDILAIYKMRDYTNNSPAHYNAVVTSLCVVEEVKTKKEFKSALEFQKYCNPYSIFDTNFLNNFFRNDIVIAIKMTYNFALKRKVTRKVMI
ncbi:MAG: hypothetical protein ACPGSG_09875, partial [Prolixibacteraceae bacterium]